jgi:hypothetical protein
MIRGIRRRPYLSGRDFRPRSSGTSSERKGEGDRIVLLPLQDSLAAGVQDSYKSDKIVN